MIRYAVIGAGWRAEFFIRCAFLCPEEFQVTSVMVRSDERAQQVERKFGLKTVRSVDELAIDKPDFAVVAVNYGKGVELTKELCRLGIPVLCETPPADSVDALTDLWRFTQETGGDVQVAEQYMWQPLYAAWYEAVRRGMLGEIQNISISALHGYHAVSVIRNFLNAGFGNCGIYGKRHVFTVTKTADRAGRCFTGETVKANRDRVTFEFENGKTAFFDFDGTQYHTYIRTRQLNIQGTRGEIDDMTIRYLTEDNVSVEQNIRRIDDGMWNNSLWSHHGIMLGDSFLYRSPFPEARMNDDEIAVAACLKAMGGHVKNGDRCYPLDEALQDTYLGIKMAEALEKPLTVVKTETQEWCRYE